MFIFTDVEITYTLKEWIQIMAKYISEKLRKLKKNINNQMYESK